MRFKIRHETKLFHYGIIAPFLAAGAAIILFPRGSFDLIHHKTATLILCGILALCVLSVMIFSVLFVIELIFGATITIQNDHVDIRMLLRHRRFGYDKIAAAKYSHYYDNETDADCHDARSLGPRLRSQLVFTLHSGKVFVLNDKATGYAAKRKIRFAHPELDPDEDVKLYQAYRCYCSAHDRYMNEKHPHILSGNR